MKQEDRQTEISYKSQLQKKQCELMDWTLKTASTIKLEAEDLVVFG